MTETVFFRGETLLLDPVGVLFWPARSLLVVADLHLEKGSACARRGQLVPPWDSMLTLERLERAIGFYAPACVLALGDSFHDDEGAGRLSDADRARLSGLAERAAFIWIAGNHDRRGTVDIPGTQAESWSLGPITFRHEAAPRAAGEISGHFHPKASVATRAASITRPCFVAGAEKIMLPAFGAYTGGLDIRAPAIRAHFPSGGRAFLLGRDRLFGFALGASGMPEGGGPPAR